MDPLSSVAAWIPPFLLVFARTVALCTQAPIIGSRAIPNMVRIALAFWISLCYVSTWKAPPAVPTQILPFVILIINGVLIGVLFGFAATMMFYAIQGGGELIASQTSLSMMSTLNPLLKTNTSAVGQLFFWVAQLAFIMIGGHLVMIGAFIHTFELIPITGLMYFPGAFKELMSISAAMLLTTLQMCMPALLVMFLIDFGLGIINRAASQVSNILEMVMAIKPSIGFVVVILMIPNVQASITSLSDTMIKDTVRMIQAGQPKEKGGTINVPPTPVASPS
ncbi:MAG TPA: hypothetical protein DD435_10610 [Cyanobacteria bacterium UBA8530]|nr:hypothetical protein [Cyanobacteria bacterium UBA8530]